MRFVKVERLPVPIKPINNPSKNVLLYLYSFMQNDFKYARVDFNHSEYKSPASAAGSLKKSITYYNYPIEVNIINGEVYLTRLDI